MCIPHFINQLPALSLMENYEFMDIIKHLVKEKKDLQARLDVLEEILHSYLPIIENKEK